MTAADLRHSGEKDTCKVMNENEHMNIVIVGHVDHGKSTIVGRLLADTGSLPEGKLEQVRMNCERNSKPFEYAFLIDALKDEQSQGITIDSARVFFKTRKRKYTIIDAPGHIEFLKNMVTGASRAEGALLVIDAAEGVQENSRRHGTMLSMLGIQQVVVLINKMDLVGYRKKVYDEIVKEYSRFLEELRIQPLSYIPVSGREGDTIATIKSSMPWYQGATVLDVLDTFRKEELPTAKPFRMPVQDVYKFTKYGDSRRIVAGTVVTGSVKVGDEVVFYPSGKKGRVKSIEAFQAPERAEVGAGYATGLTLEEQIYVTRGELATKADEPHPKVTTRLRTNLFWLGKEPLVKKKDYFIKLGTAKIPVRVEEIVRVMDASNLSTYPKKEEVGRHEIAECILKCTRDIAFDITEEIALTSRFVIVDDYEIWGGGIVREALGDKQAWVRDKVFLRNYKWEKSLISLEARAEKYNQKPSLIIVTGKRHAGKKPIARGLEGRLFTDGKVVYFLGIGNILYGVDADIKNRGNQHGEHIRRLAEVANILLDAGCLLIITAIELTQDDLEIVKAVVNPERIEVVWVGEEVTTDIATDLVISQPGNVAEAVDSIKNLLQDKGIIFKPW
jgi:bifunctional enzyme CysN/CysC